MSPVDRPEPELSGNASELVPANPPWPSLVASDSSPPWRAMASSNSKFASASRWGDGLRGQRRPGPTPAKSRPLLAETFSCIARLGSSGCGFEQPLESMRRALDGSVPDNAGFLRDDAMLAGSSRPTRMIAQCPARGCSTRTRPRRSARCRNFVFEFGVTCAEPDPRAPGPRTGCRPREDSPYLVDTDDYASFLHTLKPGPGGAFVAGLVGAALPSRSANSTTSPSSSRPAKEPAARPSPPCVYPPCSIDSAHTDSRSRAAHPTAANASPPWAIASQS